MTAPVSIADNQRGQGCQGEKRYGSSAQESNLIDIGSRHLFGGLWIQRPAEYCHGADDDEEGETEEIHDGGEDGEAVELIGQLVHEDAEDAGIHGQDEPQWCKVFEGISKLRFGLATASVEGTAIPFFWRPICGIGRWS